MAPAGPPLSCMGAGASINLQSLDEGKLLELSEEKFKELDADSSGFLENEELVKVAEWVLSSFGDVATSLEVLYKTPFPFFFVPSYFLHLSAIDDQN